MPLLDVGCNISVNAVLPTAAVLQVAPRLDEPTTCVVDEHWDIDAPHDAPGDRDPQHQQQHQPHQPAQYLDMFRNRCHRLTAPVGQTDIAYRAKVRVSPLQDPTDRAAGEVPPMQLPGEVLTYTLPSRYCLSDELAPEALQRFGHLAPGWQRVQAIVDDVHEHLTFRYGSSTASSTAVDVFRQGEGVCRDFTHLAITFCRALNIPARYVMGYIPDIGVEPPDAPMDYCAWMEVYLGESWHTFDPRLNERRIGRVVVARGRDAVDTAILTSYAQLDLRVFVVVADEDPGADLAVA
jgi:transglutaminase-like putative cysteine protease